MGKLSAPEPPAPINIEKSGAQQSKWNVKNAYQNAAFNWVNQSDALGNTVNYSQTGKDERGNPIFQASQKLGATGQQFAGGLAGLGQQYFDGANQFLSNPADYTNEATEARIAQLGSRRLDPRFARDEAALRTQLANRGLDPTSEAHRAEMGTFNEGRNDAYNQLAMNARGQAFNEAMAGRQAQVGELQGLTGAGLQWGANTTQPNPINTPRIGVNAVDIGGLQNMQAEQQQAAYQAKAQQQQALIGGLASIAGTVATLPFGGVGGSMMGSMVGATPLAAQGALPWLK